MLRQSPRNSPVRRLAAFLRRRRWGRQWRRRSDPHRGRRRALGEEAGYWEHWLASRGGKYPEEYSYRLDPTSEVQDPLLREALAAMEADEASILDVGAGPATTVGCRFPGMRLEVVAVDPLADRYDELLDDAGVVPPVRTERLEGERVGERFGEGRFDIAYSRNALDHAVDPVEIIRQMVAVVRPGGFVLLRHARNEAVSQDYVQLHQWNFDERGGDFVIWRTDGETNMTRELAGAATVVCRREQPEGAEPDEDDLGWLVCVISKHAGGPTPPTR